MHKTGPIVASKSGELGHLILLCDRKLCEYYMYFNRLH